MEKSVDLLVSEFFLYCDCFVFCPWDFFHDRVRVFAFHQYKFHFDSMYGRLDTPYGSYNMKTAKEESLDV